MSELPARPAQSVPDAQTEETPQLLTPDLTRRVEVALSRVGAFGEVRLVVVKGRLRFIQVVRSESIGDG